jgi:hypothetical protein
MFWEQKKRDNGGIVCFRLMGACALQASGHLFYISDE